MNPKTKDKDLIFLALSVSIFYLKFSLTKSWLLRFFVSRLKWKNSRNSPLESPNCSPKRKSWHLFLKGNCSYKRTDIYWKSYLHEKKNHLQSEWAFKIYGNSVLLSAISAFSSFDTFCQVWAFSTLVVIFNKDSMKVLIPAGSIETNFVEETSTLQVNKKKWKYWISAHGSVAAFAVVRSSYVIKN